MKAEKEQVAIQTEFIRLDQLLKFAGAVENGGHAKHVIISGEVAVNGETCLMRGKKLRNGDEAAFAGKIYTVVYEDH